MEQMLYLSTEIEPFLSSFGSWCVPIPYNDGWLVPADEDWQIELSNKGIAFELIDINLETEEHNEP